jgi:hypothetical protein
MASTAAWMKADGALRWRLSDHNSVENDGMVPVNYREESVNV